MSRMVDLAKYNDKFRLSYPIIVTSNTQSVVSATHSGAGAGVRVDTWHVVVFVQDAAIGFTVIPNITVKDADTNAGDILQVRCEKTDQVNYCIANSLYTHWLSAWLPRYST